MNLKTVLEDFSNESIPILDTSIGLADYVTVDLSSENPELLNVSISNPDECQNYIDEVLNENGARVAYGGFLEKRDLYATSIRFSKDKIRDIHLGMDFWCKAGTRVITPLTGKVHSFQNNEDIGNYGPTIILEHKIENISFYTLYGHLSMDSLNGLYIGKEFVKGEPIAALGTTDINVNYAPHLHFQVIKDIADFKGDYPGVCYIGDLNYFKDNCPDPNLLFKLL